MLKPQSHYLEREVLQASPIDQVILLYNKAINSLRIVEKTISEEKQTPDIVKSRVENLNKAIDILIYLSSTLDMERGKEIARNLQDIYNILIDELMKVNFTKDLKVIRDSAEILENLKKAWTDVRVKKRP